MIPLKEHKILAPWEKAYSKIATPFEHFLHQQTTTGLVLIFMTIVALVLANSAYSEGYLHFFHTYLSINIGDFSIKYSLHHWINDGLMAFFFFVIGLEIKREILTGELSDVKNAILPIIAAIGGVIFPALIYYYINYGLPGESGWGIPMATDIAFAISALVLLGKRVPVALVTFLVALAIVDDLVAVTVIAIFYTEQLNMFPLGMAFAFFGLLLAFNRFGIHKPLPYALVGILMWGFMLESGVHATIAGILTALAIPAKPKFNPHFFPEKLGELTHNFKQHPTLENYELHDQQKVIVQQLEETVHAVQAPSNRLERSLHLPVSLLVIPLFALANAGVAIDFDEVNTMVFEPVAFGIIAGLVLGKVIGIAGVSWVAIKLGIARMPRGSTMSQILGVSFLGGIGFTMSIFIAELAWPGGDPLLLLEAKTGILIASLLAGIIGFVWLRFIAKSADAEVEKD